MKRCILYSLSGLVTLSAYSQHTSNGNVPPNILLIVVDDMGFSDIQPFGGEIPPPARPRTAVLGCIIEGRTAITTPPKPL